LFGAARTPYKHTKEHYQVKPNPPSLWVKNMKLPQDKKMPQAWQQYQIHEHKTPRKVMAHKVLSKEH